MKLTVPVRQSMATTVAILVILCSPIFYDHQKQLCYHGNQLQGKPSYFNNSGAVIRNTTVNSPLKQVMKFLTLVSSRNS